MHGGAKLVETPADQGTMGIIQAFDLMPTAIVGLELTPAEVQVLQG